MLLLRHASLSGKEASHDTVLAGLLGGYVVFGRHSHSSVNQQIVIYVFARVVLAFAKMSVQSGGMVPRGFRERAVGHAWPIFASLSWGAVMWLFRWHPETIQPSMRSSMQYMWVTWALAWLEVRQRLTVRSYVNADHWDCFRNFLIHNK